MKRGVVIGVGAVVVFGLFGYFAWRQQGGMRRAAYEFAVEDLRTAYGGGPEFQVSAIDDPRTTFASYHDVIAVHVVFRSDHRQMKLHSDRSPTREIQFATQVRFKRFLGFPTGTTITSRSFRPVRDDR